MEYRQLYQSLIDRVLRGPGESTHEQRQAAFENANLPKPLDHLVDNVAREPYKVTDGDIAAAKATGASEDQLFELIICGAIGQASRQYESGLAALADVIKEGGHHAS
jgi:hypothetical protein